MSHTRCSITYISCLVVSCELINVQSSVCYVDASRTCTDMCVLQSLLRPSTDRRHHRLMPWGISRLIAALRHERRLLLQHLPGQTEKTRKIQEALEATSSLAQLVGLVGLNLCSASPTLPLLLRPKTVRNVLVHSSAQIHPNN
jgi:hypothetical protein